MMMKASGCIGFFAVSWAALSALGAEGDPLEQAFALPPLDRTRPGVRLNLDALPDAMAVDRQLDRVRQAGAGGVLVAVADGSDAVWDRLSLLCARAKEMGLEVGICDFPLPGTKAGDCPDSRALQWTVSAYSNGVDTATNAVPASPQPADAEALACLAVPQGATRVQPHEVVDLAGGSVPTSGVWHVYRFSVAPLTPVMPDALDSQTLFRHVNRFLSESQDRLNQAYGSTFLWYQLAGAPHGALLWPRDLPQLFLKTSGLNLTRYLPAVAGVSLGDAATAEYVRHQLRQTLVSAWRTRFGRNVNEWVHEAGLDAGIRVDQVPVAPEEVALYFRRPMIAWHADAQADGRNVRASGGARAMGRPLVIGSLCPATVDRPVAAPLLSFPWKEAVDLLFAEGATRLLVEMPNGIPSDDAAFRDLRTGLLYVHRCQFVLQRAEPVADVLVWSDRILPALQAFSCDYANEAVLASAVVKDGKIRFDSERSYGALAVSTTVLRDPQSARLLKQVAARGVSVKIMPAGEADDADISARFSDFAQGPGAASLDACVPDFVWQSDAPDVRLSFLHRRTDRQEIYFIVNGSAAAGTVTCSFRDVGAGTLSRWDPDDGACDRVDEARKTADGRVQAPLFFAPYDACFAVFDRQGLN